MDIDSTVRSLSKHIQRRLTISEGGDRSIPMECSPGIVAASANTLSSFSLGAYDGGPILTSDASGDKFAAFLGPRPKATKSFSDDIVPATTDNLPDAYIGTNLSFVVSTIDFLITKQDEWPTKVFPLYPTNEQTIRHTTVTFDATIPDIRPAQGVSRYVQHRSRSETSELIPRGLAFILEAGFAATPQGQEHFVMNVQNIKQSVLLLFYVAAPYALMGTAGTRSVMRRDNITPVDRIRKEKAGFAALHKNAHAIVHIKAEVDAIGNGDGANYNTIIVPPRATAFINQVSTGQLDYSSVGPAYAKNAQSGDVATKIQQMQVHTCKDIPGSADSGEMLNPLTRRRMYGSYFSLELQNYTNMETYQTSRLTSKVLNMDTSEGDIVSVTMNEGLRNCNRFRENGTLSDVHYEIARDADRLVTSHGLLPGNVDMFVVRKSDGGKKTIGDVSNNHTNDYDSLGKYKVAQYWGELSEDNLDSEDLEAFGTSFDASVGKMMKPDDDKIIDSFIATIETLNDITFDDYSQAFGLAHVLSNTVDVFGVTMEPNAYGCSNLPAFIVFKSPELVAAGTKVLAAKNPKTGAFSKIINLDAFANAVAPDSTTLKGDLKLLKDENNCNFASDQQIRSKFPRLARELDNVTLECLVAGPGLPIGYGSWPGIRTLALLSKSSAGSPGRLGYDDGLLDKAKEFEGAVIRLSVAVSKIFPPAVGDEYHGTFHPNHCPDWFRSGNLPTDSLTAFAQNLVDRYRFASFSPVLTSSVETQRSTIETIAGLACEELDISDDDSSDFAQLLRLSSSFRDIVGNANKFLQFQTQFPAQIGRSYAMLHPTLENPSSFKAFFNAELKPKFQGTTLQPEQAKNILHKVISVLKTNEVWTPSAAEINSAARGDFADPVVYTDGNQESPPPTSLDERNTKYVCNRLAFSRDAFVRFSETVGGQSTPDKLRKLFFRPMNPGTTSQPLLEAITGETTNFRASGAEHERHLSDTSYARPSTHGSSGFEHKRQRVYYRDTGADANQSRNRSIIDGQDSEHGDIIGEHVGFNEHTARRWADASVSHGTIARVGVQMALLSRITRQQCEAFLKYNILPLFSILGERPFNTYNMGSLIFVEAGGSMGYTFYGHSDFMLSTDGRRKTVEGHFTINHLTVVLNRTKVAIVPDAFAMGYVGGGGLVPFPAPFKMVDLEVGKMSVIYMMVPLRTSSGRVQKSTGANIKISSPHSLTGKWQGILGKNVDSGTPDMHAYLPSAPFYNAVYDFGSTITDHMLKESDDFYNHMFVNVLCWREHQEIFDSSRSECRGIRIDDTPFGPEVYAGVKRARCGDPVVFKEMHWERDASTQ
jgi:hypothetical protein